jgi:hypothetical protein
MKKPGSLIGAIALGATFASLILGCGSPANSAPSVADVKTAYLATSAALSSAPPATGVSFSGNGPYTYTTNITDGKGGSLFVTNTSETNPLQPPFTVTATYILTNWHDPTSGYMFYGTMTATLISSATAFTFTVNGNLSLIGGSISTLNSNYAESIIPVPPFLVLKGTVVANGYPYDVSSL